MSEQGQAAAGGAGRSAADDAGGAELGLFIVERWLPGITGDELAVVHAALAGAAHRFSARGQDAWYRGSVHLAGQQRLLSLFTAADVEDVRAVNEASLVPFARIEPATEMPNLAPHG